MAVISSLTFFFCGKKMTKFSPFISTSLLGSVSIKQTKNLTTFHWEWNEINLHVIHIQLQSTCCELCGMRPGQGYRKTVIWFWCLGMDPRVAGHKSPLSGPPCASRAGAPHPTLGVVRSGHAFWCGDGGGRHSHGLKGSHDWMRHWGPDGAAHIIPRWGDRRSMHRWNGDCPGGPATSVGRPPPEARGRWHGGSDGWPGGQEARPGFSL